MEPRRVPVGRGLSWWAAGWRQFIDHPGPWLGLAAVYFLIHLGLNLIPLAGPWIGAILGPALAGGLFQGARHARLGEAPRMAHLAAGVRRDPARRRLLALGILALAASLLLLALYLELAARQPPEAGVAGWLEPLGGLLFLILAVGMTLALWLAPPLVMFTRRTSLRALGASLYAAARNLPAVLVFGAVFVALSALAALPLGLGFLVLAPVAVAGSYEAFLELFPETGPPEPPAEPG